MIDRNPTLGYHFFEMTQARRIGNVPTHAGQHYFQRIVQPFKHACHTWIRRLHSSPTRSFRSTQIFRTPYRDKTRRFRAGVLQTLMAHAYPEARESSNTSEPSTERARLASGSNDFVEIHGGILIADVLFERLLNFFNVASDYRL